MKKPHILLIEDNEENLELMVFILKHSGFTCETGIDGEEGLQKTKQGQFDLIICDIHLPGISGFELIERLRNDLKLKKIPIIAVTAYSMIGDKEKILLAGFSGYISKPIDASIFANQVSSFLKKM